MLLEDAQGSGRLKYFAIAKRKISLEVFYHKNSHFDGKRIWFDDLCGFQLTNRKPHVPRFPVLCLRLQDLLVFTRLINSTDEL